MKLNWNFLGGLGGGGAKQKTFHGGVWIFSGTAQSVFAIQPFVGLISMAFMSPFPLAVLTTAGLSFFNSGIIISPSLAARSASFSSSRTCKDIVSGKYIN